MSEEEYDIAGSIPDEPSLGSAALLTEPGRATPQVWVNTGLTNMEWTCPLIQARGVQDKPKGSKMTDADVQAAYSTWDKLLRKGKVKVIHRAG